MGYFWPVKTRIQRWGSAGPILLLPLIFTCIYLFFPTINSSSDALGYATYPEPGPHHLLYDLLCIFVREVAILPQHTLAALKVMNALFAGGTLLAVAFILRLRNTDHPNFMVLLCGSAFGFMRFATENETYILPLFFAAIATYCYIRYLMKPQISLIYCTFLFLVISLLFHQSYIFWFAAISVHFILLHSFRISRLLPVLISVFIIFMIYFLAANRLHLNVFEWIFKDAQSGLVDLSPGPDNFKFTAINFVRTFYQVHGNILPLIETFPILIFTTAISLLLLLISFIIFFVQNITRKNTDSNSKPIQNIWLLIFIFQLAFAWFSVGNSEFMVMLPLTGAMWLSERYTLPASGLLIAGCSMLIWNLSLAIIPQHYISFTNAKTEYEKTLYRGKQLYISHDKTTAENYAYFQYENNGKKAQLSEINFMKSPADLGNDSLLRLSISNAIRDSIPVYTDCIGYPEPRSRHSMINGNRNDEFFKNYRLEVQDSFVNFYGTVTLHRVYPRY